MTGHITRKSDKNFDLRKHVITIYQNLVYWDLTESKMSFPNFKTNQAKQNLTKIHLNANDVVNCVIKTNF